MKTLSFVLIALVGTMILSIPAQSYADPQLDTLLSIASQARDHLSITISQINNVPNEITNLYNQGSSETDDLAKSVDNQDVASAKQHFLSAMQFFKATNDKINSLNSTASTDQQNPDIVQLQSEIIRMDSIGKRLKTIANANQVDIDFSQLDQFVQTARQDLDAGDITSASKAIQSAEQFVNDAHHSLTLIAKQRTSDRAKDFTEKEIQRFNETMPNLINNVQPTPPIPVPPVQNNTNATQEVNPQELVAKLRKLVSEGQVDEAIQVIKSLESYQKERTQTKANSEQSSTINSNNVTGTSGNTTEIKPITTNSSTVVNQTVTNSTITKPINETSTNSTTTKLSTTTSNHSKPLNSTNTTTPNSTKIGNDPVTKKTDSNQSTSSNVASGQQESTKKNFDKKQGHKSSVKNKHDESD